jgi:hypothetical protein
MKTIIYILLVPCILLTGCIKEWQKKNVIIEGYIIDGVSLSKIDGVLVFVSAISTAGWGSNEFIGSAMSDANGYYKLKLKIPEGTDRLDLDVNGGSYRKGYTDAGKSLYPPDIVSTAIDFKLYPTGILKIKFKNASPVNDKDFFYFGSDKTAGQGVISKEVCGTVLPTDAYTWIGKDVCGAQTIEKIGERFVWVYWSVTKNNIIKNFLDSIYVKRDVINEFNINY